MSPQLFVTHLCKALPDRVRSVVVFGSAAAGDFVEGASTYDLLILVDRLGLDELEAMGPAIRDWRESGHPLPLLFTPEQFAASADAFALEFVEMKQARTVVYGDDPVAGLAIDPAQIRMHLERELRGKGLALRDKYVLAAGDRKMTVTLLTDSVSTFLSLFRSTLRLYRENVPAKKLDALRALAAEISFDPQPFLIVEEMWRGRRSSRSVDVRTLLDQYWQAIETVTNAVDRLLHS
jgi:hypothetical protein